MGLRYKSCATQPQREQDWKFSAKKTLLTFDLMFKLNGWEKNSSTTTRSRTGDLSIGGWRKFHNKNKIPKKVTSRSTNFNKFADSKCYSKKLIVASQH